jgi:hypothetical protein
MSKAARWFAHLTTAKNMFSRAWEKLSGTIAPGKTLDYQDTSHPQS